MKKRQLDWSLRKIGEALNLSKSGIHYEIKKYSNKESIRMLALVEACLGGGEKFDIWQSLDVRSLLSSLELTL